MRQAEHLIAPAIGQNRPFPVHEPVQAAHFLEDLHARADVQMVGIAEENPTVQLLQLPRCHGFDRSLRSHRHENRCVHRPVCRPEAPQARPGLRIFVQNFECADVGHKGGNLTALRSPCRGIRLWPRLDVRQGRKTPNQTAIQRKRRYRRKRIANTTCSSCIIRILGCYARCLRFSCAACAPCVNPEPGRGKMPKRPQNGQKPRFFCEKSQKSRISSKNTQKLPFPAHFSPFFASLRAPTSLSDTNHPEENDPFMKAHPFLQFKKGSVL